uniref:phage/plasmid primase, P4 family n=1 Tax=uncultured Ruminococcus sp. TaxID=165186 RepID=UPI0025CD708B|nr:phage/plasmid primase, P4 family [uncultured Ruminococcus sp.]
MNNFDNIPQEMKELPQWVARVDKFPINPNSLYGAKSTDKTNWGTFEQAKAAIGKKAKTKNIQGKECNGIGFVLSAPFCGIDIDHCINPQTGKITAEALDIIQTMESYTEISPSGTGVHIFYKNDGNTHKEWHKKKPIDEVQHLEMYQCDRYFTVTGKIYRNYNTLCERSERASLIYQAYMQDEQPPIVTDNTAEQPKQTAFKLTSEPLTDGEIIEKAMNAKNGAEFLSLWRGDTSKYNGDESRADLALCNMLAFWSSGNADTIDRLFRQSGLMRDKWDRATGQSTYGGITVDTALRNCKEYYNPTHRADTALQDFKDCIQPSNSAAESNVKYAPVWVYQDDYGKLKVDESQYIECFAEQQGVKCINGVLYSVDGKMTDDKAKNIIFNEIKGYIKTNASDKSKKLLEGIKQFCYTEPPTPTLDRIHFKNGTLSRDKNGLFTVWSNEKEFCINRINADYNPNAKAPAKFLDYLKTVYYEDDQRTIQQYCGYCLIPTTILQKALLIIGDGGEGKSVLGAILNALFGEENCYNESISVLQSKFGVANVENKLLFIDDDLSENALTNARTFKNLVTNKTTIAAEKKFVQNNQFKSYIRFLIFGNFTLQSLYDISEGFSRRQLVLQAKPKDTNRTDNPFIDREIIETESEGVMLWIVNGLNELIKNNYKIFVSDRTQEKSEELKKQQDSVLCFLEECDSFIIRPDLQIHCNTLYRFYQEFCDKNLLTALRHTNFVAAMKTKGKSNGIWYSTNVKVQGERARGFKGIGVDVEIMH